MTKATKKTAAKIETPVITYTAAEPKAFKIRYQMDACGRCGGSGNYSYCQMHGTTCFGCSGKGEVRTKAGRNAAALVDAKLVELCAVPASALKIGDRVSGILGIKNGATVQSVGEIRTTGSYTVDGVTKECVGIPIGFRGITTTIDPASQVRLSPTPEQWAQVIELAKTLGDAVTLVETGPAVTAAIKSKALEMLAAAAVDAKQSEYGVTADAAAALGMAHRVMSGEIETVYKYFRNAGAAEYAAAMQAGKVAAEVAKMEKAIVDFDALAPQMRNCKPEDAAAIEAGIEAGRARLVELLRLARAGVIGRAAVEAAIAAGK